MLGTLVTKLLDSDENKIDVTEIVEQIIQKTLPVWKSVKKAASKAGQSESVAVGTFCGALVGALVHLAHEKGVSKENLHRMIDKMYDLPEEQGKARNGKMN